MTTSKQDILVLTDFSNTALNAAKYAVALGRQLRPSRILLCYSDYIPPSIDIPLQDAMRDEHELKKNDDQLKAWRNQLKLLADEHTLIDIHIDERPLVFAVNQLIEEQSIGMVVMGLTGKTRLEQVLIGSNTIAIAKSCNKPLLIVPEKAKFMGISKAVFACDFKQLDPNVPYDSIKGFVQSFNARLLILNVDRYDEHQFNPEVKAAEAKLRTEWGEEVEFHFTRDKDVAEGITAFAMEQEVDLIITVPQEYGFFEGLFHRSVTKQMAYHTDIPLLLFKA